MPLPVSLALPIAALATAVALPWWCKATTPGGAQPDQLGVHQRAALRQHRHRRRRGDRGRRPGGHRPRRLDIVLYNGADGRVYETTRSRRAPRPGRRLGTPSPIPPPGSRTGRRTAWPSSSRATVVQFLSYEGTFTATAARRRARRRPTSASPKRAPSRPASRCSSPGPARRTATSRGARRRRPFGASTPGRRSPPPARRRRSSSIHVVHDHDDHLPPGPCGDDAGDHVDPNEPGDHRHAVPGRGRDDRGHRGRRLRGRRRRRSAGFYVQEQDAEDDADPATSEGSSSSTATTTSSVGDVVRITGVVAEFQGQTQINFPDTLTVVPTGDPLPTRVDRDDAVRGRRPRSRPSRACSSRSRRRCTSPSSSSSAASARCSCRAATGCRSRPPTSRRAHRRRRCRRPTT